MNPQRSHQQTDGDREQGDVSGDEDHEPADRIVASERSAI
jgi:hypothetical protein